MAYDKLGERRETLNWQWAEGLAGKQRPVRILL